MASNRMYEPAGSASDAFAAGEPPGTCLIEFVLQRTGLTQNELAGRLDVSPSLISKLKTGEREPTASLITAAAALCRIDPATLFWEVHSPSLRTSPDRNTLLNRINRVLGDRGSTLHTYNSSADVQLEYLRELHERLAETERRLFDTQGELDDCAARRCIQLLLRRLQDELREVGVIAVALYEATPIDGKYVLKLDEHVVRSGRQQGGKYLPMVQWHDINVACRAIRNSDVTAVVSALSSDSTCFGGPGINASSMFEIASPIAMPKLPTLVLVVTGYQADSAWCWFHEQCLKRYGDLVRAFSFLREESLSRVVSLYIDPPQKSRTAAFGCRQQLSEHGEAHFQKFIQRVARKFGDRLAVADFWAFDVHAREFVPGANWCFRTTQEARKRLATHPDPELTVAKAFTLHREQHFRPQRLGKSFYVLMSRRPWIVYRPKKKDRVCVELGSYVAIPLFVEDRTSARICGVLYLRFFEYERNLGARDLETVQSAADAMRNYLRIQIGHDAVSFDEDVVHSES